MIKIIIAWPLVVYGQTVKGGFTLNGIALGLRQVGFQCLGLG